MSMDEVRDWTHEPTPTTPSAQERAEPDRYWIRCYGCQSCEFRCDHYYPADQVVNDAVTQAVQAERANILRAYHVTLDALGAPTNEWPCNRVKALVNSLRARLDE